MQHSSHTQTRYATQPTHPPTPGAQSQIRHRLGSQTVVPSTLRREDSESARVVHFTSDGFPSPACCRRSRDHWQTVLGPQRAVDWSSFHVLFCSQVLILFLCKHGEAGWVSKTAPTKAKTSSTHPSICFTYLFLSSGSPWMVINTRNWRFFNTRLSIFKKIPMCMIMGSNGVELLFYEWVPSTFHHEGAELSSVQEKNNQPIKSQQKEVFF